LPNKYNDQLYPQASTSSVAVNRALITPPVTPAKKRGEQLLAFFTRRDLEARKKKEKEDEEKLLRDDSFMEIETVNNKKKTVK
jgi:hypothetical protein